MTLLRPIEMYVGRTDHTWRDWWVNIPADTPEDQVEAVAKAKLQAELEETKNRRQLDVSFIGVYCTHDDQCPVLPDTGEAMPFGGSHAPNCPYRAGGECDCWRSDPKQNPELASDLPFCERCDSPVNKEGFCTDETCPFTDHKQDCPRGWTGHPDRDPHPTDDTQPMPCTCGGRVIREVSMSEIYQQLPVGATVHEGDEWLDEDTASWMPCTARDEGHEVIAGEAYRRLYEAVEMVEAISSDGKVRVVLENIGEGLSGDFDSEDPEDLPLMRYDVYRWFEANEEWPPYGYAGDADPEIAQWAFVTDGSYCTRIDARADPEKIKKAARMILEALHDDIAAGHHPRRRMEELSWTEVKYVGGDNED